MERFDLIRLIFALPVIGTLMFLGGLHQLEVDSRANVEPAALTCRQLYDRPAEGLKRIDLSQFRPVGDAFVAAANLERALLGAEHASYEPTF